jgi:hypothetical protein
MPMRASQFGGDVGNIFAGQMGAAQLGDRIVAVPTKRARKTLALLTLRCRLQAGLSGKEISYPSVGSPINSSKKVRRKLFVERL